MAEIILENVSKGFKGVPVLKNISLHCQPGRAYGLVGYNGCGKTVMLKCICGFLKCDSGQIRIDGKIMGREMDMLNNAGIIIEEPGFVRTQTAFQNLDFLYCLRNPSNRQHIYSVLGRVGLDPKLKKRVGRFSLGMKQRLAIAQAIMEDPEILILDEPMNGLDKQGVAEMYRLFTDMKQKGKTILLASHNPKDISALCDEVYEFEDGTLHRMPDGQN